MKFLKLILTAAFAIPAMAFAESHQVLECAATLDQNRPPYSFESIQIRGEYVNGWFKDFVAQVSYTNYRDEKIVTTGRSAELDRDEKYVPRKYVNHDRYNLENLTETEKFGKFYPADTCNLELLIPKDIRTVVREGAPLLIHCDQSGGAITLKCTLK
ncbi:MAG: hypothetical protein EOP09_04265 [Proteobacteria bacterium]|nr:MAG: hypothetical protein EOP09_04265 [Pseudomonadota bacterium]